MKICPNCKNQVADNHNFCISCGQPLINQTSNQQPTQQEPIQNQQYQPRFITNTQPENEIPNQPNNSVENSYQFFNNQYSSTVPQPQIQPQTQYSQPENAYQTTNQNQIQNNNTNYYQANYSNQTLEPNNMQTKKKKNIKTIVLMIVIIVGALILYINSEIPIITSLLEGKTVYTVDDLYIIVPKDWEQNEDSYMVKDDCMIRAARIEKRYENENTLDTFIRLMNESGVEVTTDRRNVTINNQTWDQVIMISETDEESIELLYKEYDEKHYLITTLYKTEESTCKKEWNEIKQTINLK